MTTGHHAVRRPASLLRSTMNSIAVQIRRSVLEQSMRAHVGHVGSALSIADLLAALYGGVLRIGEPDDPDRDRFVLSKGHAALALYAALHATGRLSTAELDTYCMDGSLLGGHPEHALDYVDFATGSLGHGLSIAAGAALAARMQRSPRRVYALMSDAECNEGSVWEAAMFAAHHQLSNLVAIIDVNGQQALGYTSEVIDLEPLAERWRAFGWDVHEPDGHDVAAVTELISELDTHEGPPHMLLARTTFGKGVSYMEGQIAWHYWPMNEAQFNQAIAEVEGAAS
jgi:transketolase